MDENRVGCMGGSQGGALALACATLEPRITRVAPYYPWLCDYKRAWKMGPMFQGYDGIREFLGHFDPTHDQEDAVFTKLGYVDIQHLASRIRGEVLMATGLMDNICPPSAQFAVYNKISSRKNIVLYPEYGHELLP